MFSTMNKNSSLEIILSSINRAKLFIKTVSDSKLALKLGKKIQQSNYGTCITSKGFKQHDHIYFVFVQALARKYLNFNCRNTPP